LETFVQDRIMEICDKEDCEEVEFDKVFEIKAAPGGKSLTQFYTLDKKHGFITGKNLNGNNNLTYINDIGYEKCKNYTVKYGDILIQEVYNENSKCLIVPKEWNNFVFKGCFRLRVKNINKNYLLFYLNSDFFKTNALNSTTGSIFEHLSISILKNMKIKIPKNKQLIKDLEPTFEEIESLQGKIKENEELYQQYIKELGEEAIIDDNKEESKPKKNQKNKELSLTV